MDYVGSRTSSSRHIMAIHLEKRFAAGTHIMVNQGRLIGSWDMHPCAGIAPTDLVGTTIRAFVVAAIPEETFKLLALWLILRKNPHFDEHFDGIVYAVCVGLGFAAIENVFYILGEEEWMSVAVSRALLAVPAHYAFAIFMGYYYSVYHFVDHSIKNAICILFIPVMAHGIYDAIVFAADMIPALSIVITTVLIVFCSKMWKYAKARMEELMLRN